MARKEALLRLHKLLLARRDALRRALDGDMSSLRELAANRSGDPVDAALDLAQNEVSSQLAELESRELQHTERAIERMKQGTYGLCEHCGNKIPLARLNALPYSTTCIDCQRDQERSGEGGGGAGDDWERVYDTERLGKDDDVNLSDVEFDLSESR
jgi:DnaK suppressor protein